MLELVKKIIGSKNDRELKRIQPLIKRTSAREPEYEKLSDTELRAKTDDFRNQLRERTAETRQLFEQAQARAAVAAGEEREELKTEAEKLEKELRDAETLVLEDFLPEAFAAVREASRRTIGLRHFDVQLIGGVVLHEGKIAEMKTGEGKTLVATLALYLNALTGRGAH